jgi:hypothetical protein
LSGGNSEYVIVRQRTSDKSSAAKLEDNLNRFRGKKTSNFNLPKMRGGGVLDYKIRKVKRCTLRKERKAEEIAGIEKHKGREK